MNLKMIACAVGTCILFAVNASAQQKQSGFVRDLVSVSFLDPGISAEISVGKRSTIYGKLFLKPAFSYSHSSSYGSVSTLDLEPAISSQYRYYYNHAKRESNGKNTGRNSMNYVALYTDFTNSSRGIENNLREQKSRLISTVAIVWGFQRNYTKRFHLEFSAGPGILYGKGTYYSQNIAYKKTERTSIIAGQLSLGLWLGKK